MGFVLTLKDGSHHAIINPDELMDLIDQYMGLEMRQAVEALQSDLIEEYDDAGEYLSDLEKENQQLQDHHKKVMGELRKISEKLAGEIRQSKQDRMEISHLAGRIGIITGRECG